MATTKKVKTYVETQREKPINWFEELQKATSLKEIRTLKHLSGSWVTCACGNQCEVIPRDGLGEPRDEILAELGYEFHQIVNGMLDSKVAKYKEKVEFYRESAIETLHKIEKRSAVLIRQVNKKKK